jgi:phospholipid/cholesterol/gamma-HCH transport system substrate-binding protein
VKRTGRVPFMRLQVGLLVLVSFIILLWATFQSGRIPIFSREDRISLVFSNIGGLEEEAIVRLNGVPVGHVREISFEPDGDRVRVDLGVDRGLRARIHRGAVARITTVGFLSELYLAIDGGDPAAPPIASDTEIEVVEPTDPQVLVKRVEALSDSLEVLMGNLNRAGRELGRGEGTLGKLSQDDRLYDQLVSLSRSGADLAARFDRNQEAVTGRFLSVAASMDTLAERLKSGRGTAGQLINSDDLHRELAASAARLDSILTSIQSGQGTLGMLYADSTLFTESRTVLRTLRGLTADIERNPRRYFKFSVF